MQGCLCCHQYHCCLFVWEGLKLRCGYCKAFCVNSAAYQMYVYVSLYHRILRWHHFFLFESWAAWSRSISLHSNCAHVYSYSLDRVPFGSLRCLPINETIRRLYEARSNSMFDSGWTHVKGNHTIAKLSQLSKAGCWVSCKEMEHHKRWRMSTWH